jgi:hypothetical protein
MAAGDEAACSLRMSVARFVGWNRDINNRINIKKERAYFV